MPYKIIKRKCKQSSGKKGKYIVAKKSDNKKQSCHTSKKKAQSAVKARYANESALKEYVKLLIESESESEFEKILRAAIQAAKNDEKKKKTKPKDSRDPRIPVDISKEDLNLLS